MITTRPMQQQLKIDIRSFQDNWLVIPSINADSMIKGNEARFQPSFLGSNLRIMDE